MADTNNTERLIKLLERIQHASTEGADLVATVAAYRRLLGGGSPADLLSNSGITYRNLANRWRKQAERLEKSRDDAWDIYHRANADLECVKVENARLRKQAREGSKAELKRELGDATARIELLEEQLRQASRTARQKLQPRPAEPDLYFEYAA